MAQKGIEIRFVKGKYMGKNGWRNAMLPDTDFYTHVILSTEHGEVLTRVRKDSVAVQPRANSFIKGMDYSNCKGQRILFKRGKYKGLTGWKNTERKDTDCYAQVLVDIGTHIHATKVLIGSIVSISEHDSISVLEPAKGEKAESRKGSPIRFVAGTYKGKTGWKDVGKGTTDHRICVIVDMGSGREKMALVSKRSWAEVHQLPKSIQEAALQQHTAIDDLMSNLATLLSTMDFSQSSDKERVTIVDPELKAGFVEILVGMIDKASRAQAKLGSDAVWKPVQFSNTLVAVASTTDGLPAVDFFFQSTQRQQKQTKQ